MRVGVVVLNWNGWRDTVECLDSLLVTCPGPARVLVVDNGSSDDSLAQLHQWAREKTDRGRVEILTSPSNLGFAGGNNLGLKHLTQDPSLTHFLLLNNDAAVAPDFFERIAAALQEHPQAAVLGPTILTTDAEPQVWYAGAWFQPATGRVIHNLIVPRDPATVSTESVSGCAMVIARQTLDAIGYLPECYYPIYLEDWEYCYRVIEAGRRIVYVPAAVVRHKVSATMRQDTVAPRVPEALRGRIAAARRRGVTPATVQGLAAPVRELARWLGRRGVAAYLLPRCALPRPVRYVPHIYTDQQLAALFTQTDRCRYCAEVPLRHLVMPVLFRTIYACGLRCSEARLLRVADVDIDTGVLQIRDAKGGKDRQVPVSGPLRNRLAGYHA